MAGAQMLDLARHAADVQTQMLNSVRSTMNAIAATQPLPTGPQELAACGQAMARIADVDEFIDNLSIASIDGHIVCSDQPKLIGMRIGDRGYFQRALMGRSFTVSNILNGRQFKRPLIAAAFPKTRADGSTEFVVIAALQLTWLETTIAKLASRPNTSAFVVDSAGNVIARSPRSRRPCRPERRKPYTRPGCPFRKTGPFSAMDFDGVVRRFAAVKLDETGAHFGAGLDENAVLENINRQISIAYWVIAGAITIVLLGAWFGSERIILRPMRALVEKAVRFGNGDYSTVACRVKIPSDFAPLDHALDQMAEQLASREQTLKEENRQLDHLAQLGQLDGFAQPPQF